MFNGRRLLPETTGLSALPTRKRLCGICPWPMRIRQLSMSYTRILEPLRTLISLPTILTFLQLAQLTVSCTAGIFATQLDLP